MSVTPASVKAAFQDAIPHRRDEFARRVEGRLRTIVHEDQYVQRFPFEVLLMAEDELRERIKLAAERVKQLIISGWTEAEMVNVRKVFLDCFGTFDRMDKDPQSDLYRAVEAAFESVGQHNPAQATMNHRRLSEVQVQAATEFLSDLELYYAERHPEPAQNQPQIPSTAQPLKPVTGTLSVTLDDAAVVAEAVASWQSDVFISYAFEDRQFVRELAGRLRDHDVRVWVDETELTVGDSLRGKIDEALKSCEYGIVVLSRPFFSKDWPRLELDGLLSIQTSSNRKVILPVWHGIDAVQIRQYSPILAGHLATRSADGVAKVTNDLLRVLKPNAVPAATVESPTASPLPLGSFRDQIIQYVQEGRNLVLRYGSTPTPTQREEILTNYIEMASARYHALKHHLEQKLGYKRVEALAKLPMPMTLQAIIKTLDVLETLAIDVPDYLPAYAVELDDMA
jgi:hypothetical protein